MKPIEYLKKQLEKVAVEFPDVQIRYEYNTLIETHIVEFTPEVEYYNNHKLDDTWMPISMEFQHLFPNQEIAFISSDSTLRVKTPSLIYNEKIVELVLEDLFNSILNTEIKTNINFIELDFTTTLSDLPDFENLWTTTNINHVTRYNFVAGGFLSNGIIELIKSEQTDNGLQSGGLEYSQAA